MNYNTREEYCYYSREVEQRTHAFNKYIFGYAGMCTFLFVIFYGLFLGIQCGESWCADALFELLIADLIYIYIYGYCLCL